MTHKRKSAPKPPPPTTTATCSYSHPFRMSNARHQTTTTTTSNMYSANISSLSSSSRQQPISWNPTEASARASLMIINKMFANSDAISPRKNAITWAQLSIVCQLNVGLDKHHHCHSLLAQFNSDASSNFISKSNKLKKSRPTKAPLFIRTQQQLSFTNNIFEQQHFKFRPINCLANSAANMSLVSQFMPTAMTNQLISSKPVALLSNVIARFASSLPGANINSIGSGRSIEDEQEMILNNSKGNKVVKINACGRLYTELARTRPHLFGTAPKGRGIDFQVHYYDSLELIEPKHRRPNAPVVCLLHGAPGHYKDFASLIDYLTIKGVRVIAPNFPDYSATFEHSFRHSPRERLEFLLEFFKAIKLNKIDMMIGHSSAVYTIFHLLNHSLEGTSSESDASSFKPQIRSLGLFSVPSHELPSNMSVTPFRLFTLRLFDFPIMRPLILALIQTFVKLQGIQNRVDRDKIENLLIAASAVGYSEHSAMKDHLKLIHRHKLPTFMLVGTADRLIPMGSFDRLKVDLGVSGEDEVKFYNSDGSVRRQIVSQNDLIDVSEFDNGGHYTFQRFASQVNDDVYSFLIGRVIRDSFESTKL